MNLAALLHKIGVTNRLAAAAMAGRLGLIGDLAADGVSRRP